MSVAQLNDWRLPGCGSGCWPRSHDPVEHEQYGRELEREQARRSVVRTGPLVIDLRRERVWVEGHEVPLSEREWQILAYLAERAGQNCQSSDIRAAIWGVHISAHVVSVVICRLRIRLGPAGRLVVGKRGWRFYRLDVEEPTCPTS